MTQNSNKFFRVHDFHKLACRPAREVSELILIFQNKTANNGLLYSPNIFCLFKELF